VVSTNFAPDESEAAKNSLIAPVPPSQLIGDSGADLPAATVTHRNSAC
jgi:hypothetical protein